MFFRKRYDCVFLPQQRGCRVRLAQVRMPIRRWPKSSWSTSIHEWPVNRPRRLSSFVENIELSWNPVCDSRCSRTAGSTLVNGKLYTSRVEALLVAGLTSR
jgi:hypothetical protein